LWRERDLPTNSCLQLIDSSWRDVNADPVQLGHCRGRQLQIGHRQIFAQMAYR